MTGVVVVTGATGTVGRAVIELLAAEPGVTVRATTRRPSARPASQSEHVTWVGFDWDHPDSVGAVVAGADTLFLLPPTARHPLPAARCLLDHAANAGVAHVVFLSTFGADFDPGFAFGRWALTGEHATAASGLPYTVLRPNSFMTNFLSMMRPGDDGALRLPWGTGATSFVDVRDVAAVAARVLLEPRHHAGATYALTGPDALSIDAIAVIIRDVSGEPIRYVDTPTEVVRAKLSSSGMPAPMVTAFMELHKVMASGARAELTPDVRRVTRQPPRSFAQFAADHAQAWMPPGLRDANGRNRG